jgi:hypothetical protein
MSVLKKVAGRMGQKPAAPAAPGGTSMGAELERLRRQNAELAAENAKTKADAERNARALSATQAERDQERMRSALISHAQRANAVDAEDVADAFVLRKRVALVDGKLVAADDPTKDAEAAVREYLAAKPHLVRGQQASGSGASPNAAPIPGPPAPKTHDMKTGEGRTAAAREALREMAKTQQSPTPTAPGGRGAVS